MRSPQRDKLAEEIAALTDKVADLETHIKALRKERASLTQVTDLEREIEKLKLEKARLIEDNDRKIRETEHKVGLLKTKQDHDVEHARRMAQLEVRESNLDADKKRFAEEMKFQREHLQGEVDRIDSILGKILERLPTIEVELSGPARTASRKAADS
jgi:hypothetical protein